MEKRRPPPELRAQIDIGFRVEGQSIVIFELHPDWMDGSAAMLERTLAKATYSKKTALWAIYWMKADLKWHRYPPVPAVGKLEAFISILDKDEHGSFWG